MSFEYESETDDALILQADEGVIYSPGSADPPAQQSPVLRDPEPGSAPEPHPLTRDWQLLLMEPKAIPKVQRPVVQPEPLAVFPPMLPCSLRKKKDPKGATHYQQHQPH